MKPGRGIFCPFRVNLRIFSGSPTRLSFSLSRSLPLSDSLPPSLSSVLHSLSPSLFTLPTIPCPCPRSIHWLTCVHLFFFTSSSSSASFSVLSPSSAINLFLPYPFPERLLCLSYCPVYTSSPVLILPLLRFLLFLDPFANFDDYK